MHQVNFRLKIIKYKIWLRNFLTVFVLLLSSVTLSVLLASFLTKSDRVSEPMQFTNFFADIALDSPVYFECRHLIKQGIIKQTNLNFKPLQPIKAAYWNYIVKGIEIAKKAKFPNSVYFNFKEKLTNTNIRKKCVSVALALGISPSIDRIPERAFKDISKINILSILDSYFTNSNKGAIDET